MTDFNICNNKMGDEEIMSDVLESQKQVTGLYNNVANESATPQLRNEFLSILNDEHEIQCEIFSEMQKRGWYPTQAADQQQINQAKQKYTVAN